MVDEKVCESGVVVVVVVVRAVIVEGFWELWCVGIDRDVSCILSVHLLVLICTLLAVER